MKFPAAPDRDCVICYEQVAEDLPEHQTVRVPCCGRHFHRACIQQYAVISGKEHFKCSNCNDRSRIIRELERMGIYLPVKDADWEANTYSGFYNYQDMYQQKKSCNVVSCLAGNRELSQENTEDEILLCSACGINGSHIKCAGLSLEDSNFTCGDCGGDVEMQLKPADSTAGDSSLRSDLSFSSLDSSQLLDSSVSDLDSTSTSVDSSLLSDSSISCPDTSDSLPSVEETSPLSAPVSKEDDGELQTKNITGSFFKLAEDFSNLLDELRRKEPEKNAFLEETEEKDEETTKESSHAVVRFLADNHQRATESCPRPFSLKIRKDIFINDRPTNTENIHGEKEESSNHNEQEKIDTDIEVGQGPAFVIPEKKRKFAAFLMQRPAHRERNSRYLREFYQMLAPEDFKPSAEEAETVISLDKTFDTVKESEATTISIVETFSLNAEANKGTSVETISPTSQKVSKKNSPVQIVEENSKKRSEKTENFVKESPAEPGVAGEPSVGPGVKHYRPGPRSRTKPHLSPVRQTPPEPAQAQQTRSPFRSLPPVQTNSRVQSNSHVQKQSPVQNQSPVHNRSQVQNQSPVQKPSPVHNQSPVQNQSLVNNQSPVQKQSPVQNKALIQSQQSVQPPVKYRPGPKSRKKFLVVKENEEKTGMVEALNPKRKSDDTLSPTKRRKVEIQADESIKDIENFIKETETILEVSPAPPDQAALDRRRAKRPFQCPVCEGFFRSQMVLKQHMAKIHFWQRILQLPRETPSLQGPFWVCSEVACSYIQKSKEVVAGHLATEHAVVFDIAKTLFPAFELPKPVVTIDDDDVVMVQSNNNNNNLSEEKSGQPTQPYSQVILS